MAFEFRSKFKELVEWKRMGTTRLSNSLFAELSTGGTSPLTRLGLNS